jgi:hypothetical protein
LAGNFGREVIKDVFVQSIFCLVISSSSISLFVISHFALSGPTTRTLRIALYLYPLPLSTAMSCSVGIQQTSTSIHGPWDAGLGLWPADDQIEGLESMPPTFSTWDFSLSQDLYSPDLTLNAIHDPGRSPGVNIDQQLSESLGAQTAPSNSHLKNHKSRGERPTKTGIKKSSSRERFLERNRQAASRCRQKRKEHTQVLESRFKEESTKHQQLQSEFRCLRMEILGLKNEVLKHAHCTDNHISEYLSQMLERVSS